MKYENQRPDLADQVKALVQSANSTKTGPHGIKTVEPGEGLQLLSNDGAEIFWDWETASTWDTRIQEGRAAIEQARADLDKAEQDLAAGAARVEENRTLLDALGPRVESAESTVAQASKDLTALQGTVGNVSAAADAAAQNAKNAVMIGVSGNIFPDPGLTSAAAAAAAWLRVGFKIENGNWIIPATNAQTGIYFGLNPSESLAVPVEPGQTYRLSATVVADKPVTKNNVIVLYTRLLSADRATFEMPAPITLDLSKFGGTLPAGTPTEISGTITVPKGRALLAIGFYTNGQNQSDVSVTWSRPVVRLMTPGALVVNGSITGEKVEGKSVAAEVVRSMTAEHKNLVVTESAILQHTTLLGTTVADELNVRRLIRGRDAILDGTVDIAQLNVTGEMSAQIARFMDAEARKLIVTEDAILNRATVVEGLVTPELISKKANIEDLAARMITSGMLQTDPAATRGVKLDNAGIRAWDDTGSQTVQINGRTNYLVGELSTAPDKQRVRLRSTGSIAAADFFGSNDTRDHLAIWHQADAGQDTVSKIISHHDVAQVKGNPGMLMFPFRGEFTFTGRWAQESDTVKFFRMDNDRGLSAGGYIDVVYTYRFAFTSQYTVLMPYLSVETASGRECIAMIMQITYSTIKIRIVNKSAGDTGALKVRGVVFNVNEGLYSNYF